MVIGVFGAVVAELFHITAKRMRNSRYARRGEPPAKDVVFRPLWVLFAILGLMAGLGWTWRLEGTWLTGAVAGLGIPAFASLVWLGWGLSQLRR
ncbi:MAG: hypothetical protein H0V17_20665 [Deltaproteobacteria bacterium]|nr:hypothetical protein [Deltaproteobacteria bacterium]